MVNTSLLNRRVLWSLNKIIIDETINEQNRNTHRPCYDRVDKCWRVTFPDRDAEEGDLLYVASEYTRTGLYFPYYTTKAMGGRGLDHYFEGVLEALLNDPEGFSIYGYEEYYSRQEIEMLKSIQKKLREG